MGENVEVSRLATGLLVGLAAFAAVGAAWSAARGPYVRANARLLVLARPYPGARLTRVEIDPYSDPYHEFGPPLGYTTVAYYALSKPANAAAVASFYSRELPGWTENTFTVGCQPIGPPPGAPTVTTSGSCAAQTVVSFGKGEAGIELQGLGSGAHFDLAIDSKYFENLH